MTDYQYLELVNVSPTLWLKADTGVTADANNRVSAWADQSGAGRNFAQAVDANKPLLTRSDNQENRIYKSDDISAALTFSKTSAVSASVIRATAAGVAYAYQPFVHGPSVQYVVYFKVKRGTWDYCWIGDNTGAGKGVGLDLSNGTITRSDGLAVAATISAIDAQGFYTVEFTIAPVSSSVNFYIEFSPASGNAVGSAGAGWNGTQNFEIKNLQVRATTADAVYLANTLTAGQFAGVGGRSAVFFGSGSSKMTSTATLSQVITNSAFTTYAVVTSSGFTQNSANRYANDAILKDSGGYWGIYGKNGVTSLYAYNYDGSYDAIDSAFTAGTLYILEFRHGNGTIYHVLNTVSQSTASGNTSDLTGTLEMGASTYPSNVRILELMVFNSELADQYRAGIYRYLDYKY